ncbi:hypothetical protein CC85DRAFT_281824 [Cutaneotrichosporon oleaginosum]|uniref:SGNH hydrolase-type esterase domain-containing protein n=1 Tax=Cutaneotrichosporon oleaginosum TaxID=879819 RepID=A0A0J0XYP3_9TREE|nr:uncharacterized protein CC85DRAFT_281824 [Cutaneotrichosporon oleaginosum]KLT46168.1 hypothetical protein CC85DRAFT_281824 [Cutaneotrichosporon oleaginosum]TXT10177.1 hypothetical protein COLE_04111 [Cutaneotrichosporon oleaginosum]
MVAVGRTPALVAGLLSLTAISLLLLTHYESVPSVVLNPFFAPDSFHVSGDRECVADIAPLRDTFASNWGVPLRTSLVRAGTGARVRRAMERLRKERRITIGVLGGSITFGHGLHNEDKRYAQLVQEGLAAAFPDAEIVVQNGAVPATGTDYFAACYKHHVPADADLFILEGAVNDLMVQANTDASVHQDVITDTETLVRELLKGGAAVMMLSTWGMTNGYMNGADQHSTVAEYYDVPRISTRAALYQYIQAHPDAAEEIFVHGDLGHYNAHGHRFMAEAILDHLLEQACKPSYTPPYAALHGAELSAQLDPFALPPLRIRQRLGDPPLADPDAFCKSSNVQLPDGTWQLEGETVEGHPPFEKIVWHDKHYWAAEEIGARVIFPDVEVSGGFLGLYYLRSGSMGLGNLRCWADGNEGAAKLLIGHWGYVSVGSVGAVATGLAPGKHTLTCEVDKTTHAQPGDHVEGSMHKTRIIAVIAS